MNEYFLPALSSGMLDERTERARKLIGLSPKYPIITLDSLENVYPKPINNRPLLKEIINKHRYLTEGLYIQDRPVIYINRGARPYREKDYKWLASVIAHENEHAKGYSSDADAYKKQLEVLDNLEYDDKNDNYTRMKNVYLGLKGK